MTWTNVYLVCFLLGFSLTVFSWLLTMAGGHLPGLHGGPHGHGGGLHTHAGRPAGRPGGGGASSSATAAPSPVNFSTLTTFLAWFGGAGYLLIRYAHVWPIAALALALGIGVAGAAVVFWFMAKVLWSPDENLDPDDFDVVGLLGTVSSPIRDGGTGEILFQQAGARRVAGARSETGEAIAKGVEVVITNYANGLVYVRTWDEMVRR